MNDYNHKLTCCSPILTDMQRLTPWGWTNGCSQEVGRLHTQRCLAICPNVEQMARACPALCNTSRCWAMLQIVSANITTGEGLPHQALVLFSCAHGHWAFDQARFWALYGIRLHGSSPCG